MNMKKIIFFCLITTTITPFFCHQDKISQTTMTLVPNTTVIRAWSYFRYKHPMKKWKFKIHNILLTEKKLLKDNFKDYLYILVSYKNFNFYNPYDPQTFKLLDPNKKLHTPTRYFSIAKEPDIGKSSKFRNDLYLFKFGKGLKNVFVNVSVLSKKRKHISKKFFTNNGITPEMTKRH